MRTLLACLLISFSASAALGQSSPCVSDPTDLREITQAFSSRSGTKFVLDPRVRGKATTIGLDLDSIDMPVLVGILNVHGYEVLESDGAYYVVPESVAGTIQEKLDRID